MLNTKHARNKARAGFARDQKRLNTRQLLLEAALQLLEGEKSFSSLSLREVTREVGIVPTAFYRHFSDMEALGLALVDECMGTLRSLLRTARATPLLPDQIISQSVAILSQQVHDHHLHFRFIARERYGGLSAIRQAIRREIQSFTSELALDLGRLPALNRWSADDLQMMAGLIVNALVSTAEAILEAPPQRPEVEQHIVKTAERQLRLIVLGVAGWKSA